MIYMQSGIRHNPPVEVRIRKPPVVTIASDLCRIPPGYLKSGLRRFKNPKNRKNYNKTTNHRFKNPKFHHKIPTRRIKIGFFSKIYNKICRITVYAGYNPVKFKIFIKNPLKPVFV